MRQLFPQWVERELQYRNWGPARRVGSPKDNIEQGISNSRSFLRNETMFFTSTFCGSLFCGSAVHIVNDLVADSLRQSADRRDQSQFCNSFQGQNRVLPPQHRGIFEWLGFSISSIDNKSSGITLPQR